MLKFITRLMCYAISLQLFVGCNSSMLAVEGSGSFFDISGLIVKTFHKASDVVFPSAMAATATGEVVAYTVDDDYNMVEIASFTLYDNEKAFNFKVDKRKVNQRILFFRYEKIGAQERREKYEPLEGTEDKIYTELDAEATFAADVIKQEIADVVKADPKVKYEIVKDIVRNFDPREYDGVIKEVGGYDGYVKQFKNEDLAALAGPAVYQSRGEKDPGVILAELKPALVAAQYADVLGGKLKCVGPTKVEVVDTLGKGKFDGHLYFETEDSTTKDILGNSSVDVGGLSTAEEGNKIIASFSPKLNEAALAKKVKLIGNYLLKDSSNGIKTICKVVFDGSSSSSSVSVDLSILKSIDVSIYKSADEAIKAIGEAYNKTIQKLEESFKAAGINIHDGADGSKAYESEVKKAKQVNEELIAKAKGI